MHKMFKLAIATLIAVVHCSAERIIDEAQPGDRRSIRADSVGRTIRGITFTIPAEADLAIWGVCRVGNKTLAFHFIAWNFVVYAALKSQQYLTMRACQPR
jgi:hypothetical protein